MPLTDLMNPNNITYNPDTENFDALIAHNGKMHRMTLIDFNKDEIAPATLLANSIGAWLQTNLPAAIDFCTSKLLTLKNETWLDEDEDEQPLSAEAFAERVEWRSVVAYSEGSFTLYFDDNDLFWGHSIIVEVDKDLQLKRANLAG